MNLPINSWALASCIVLATPLVMAAVECDPISKYTTEWFLGNTIQRWSSIAFDSTALFYTQGLSQRAQEFARDARNNKVTIWDVWPCENYWIKTTRQNPLRCIMANVDEERYYFGNMSQAFAMKAANVAAVMHRDIENPPMTTIWGTIELPALQAATKPFGTVNYIVAIDAEDVTRRKIAWRRYIFDKIYDHTEPMIQRVLYGRSEETLDKREEARACPMMNVDSRHPLW